ncbi:MAG: hypothetical protein U0Q15_14830 [Kineosporiaceae bacterium]
MTDTTHAAATHADDVVTGDTTARRRALLTLGAIAGAGVLGVAKAGPAEAAATTLRVGELNNGGNARTALVSTCTSGAFDISVKAASGRAMLLTGDGGAMGLLARTMTKDSWGAQVTNWGSTAGTGGALWAMGVRNTAIKCDTWNASLPALLAVAGNSGAGLAIQATGDAYLDGNAMALRSWVGVPTVDDELGYAPVSSSQNGAHTVNGKVTLSGGTATVTLPADYLAAIQRADATATPPQADTLMVQLTPVGASMPNLYVATITETGFTIAGGVGSGTVFWQATAERLWLAFTAAGAQAGVAGAKTAITKSGASVVSRRSLDAARD